MVAANLLRCSLRMQPALKNIRAGEQLVVPLLMVSRKNKGDLNVVSASQ